MKQLLNVLVLIGICYVFSCQTDKKQKDDTLNQSIKDPELVYKVFNPLVNGLLDFIHAG